MMFYVDADPENLRAKGAAFPGALTDEIRKGLKDASIILIDESRKVFSEHYQTHTGKAAEAIQIDESKATDTSSTVGVNLSVAPYGEYLHDGTDDHWVEPKDKKALHWVSGGQSMFSKGHMVSGIEEYKYIHIAADRVKDKIVACVEDHIRLALAKVGLI
jgi:hypothetical protein